MRTILLSLLWLVTASPSSAGPPLISDDPHTVGPGVFEGILAVTGFELQGVNAVQAPVFDLTLGLFEGLDVILTAGPTHNIGRDVDLDADGNLLGGVKWQFLRRDHVSASITPAAGVDLLAGGKVLIVFPLQLEYTGSRFAIGTDAGYIVNTDAPDQWYATLYATTGPWRKVTFVGELWSVELPSRSAQLGFNLGIDWEIPFGVHVLASGGAGLASTSGDRAGWVAYLGLQRDFTLWKPRRSGP